MCDHGIGDMTRYVGIFTGCETLHIPWGVPKSLDLGENCISVGSRYPSQTVNDA